MSALPTRSRGVFSSPASIQGSPSFASSPASGSMSSKSALSSVSPTSSPRSIPSGSEYQYSPPAVEPQLHPATRAYKSSTPRLANPRTQDVFASIVKGRKSWKTLRGGEVVWPPELEAALIEGLENYQPDDSRETRLLGRFPMRNRFISDWIFERTGTRRSAKQVGSRLQQLRDTCGGKKLMKLLSPVVPSAARRHSHPYLNTPQASSSRSHPNSPSYSSVPFPPPPLSGPFPGPSAYGAPASPTAQAYAHNGGMSQPSYAMPSALGRSHGREHESESGSDSSTPTTPTDTTATLQNLLYRGIEPRGSAGGASTELSYDAIDNVMAAQGVRTVVLIDLLPESDNTFVQGSSTGVPRAIDAGEAQYQAQGYTVARASPHARRLAEIDPTTTLISRAASTPSECYSYFTVYDDEGHQLFTECTSMHPVSHPAESDFQDTESVLYQTSLVPGYWPTIVQSGNASRYAILQKVIRHADEVSNDEEEVLFLAMYRFVYSPSSSPSPSSTSTSSLSPLSSSSHLSSSGYEEATPTQLHLQTAFTKADSGSYDLEYDQTLLSSFATNNYQQPSLMDDMSGMESMMGYKSMSGMANANNFSTNMNNNINTTSGWMGVDINSLTNNMSAINTSTEWASNYSSPVDQTPTQDMFGYTGMP